MNASRPFSFPAIFVYREAEVRSSESDFQKAERIFLGSGRVS